MAKQLLQPPLASLMKEGTRAHDQPVLKNIEACRELQQKTRSSLGPDGLNKLVINHIGKTFVTHDAATIMKEMEVEHPAAKLLVMASKSIEEEVGDATNLVVILAGEFLHRAEQLIRSGLHSTDVVQGYLKAGQLALDILQELVVETLTDMKDEVKVRRCLRTVVGSKQHGFTDHLTGLVATACTSVCPSNPKSFNVDNVRILKVTGGSVRDSASVNGFVIARDSEGTVKKTEKSRIAVFNCAIDSGSTETKGTVHLHSAEELMNFSKTEEASLDRIIGAIAQAGVGVVVSSQSFGDLALHFIEKYGMMAVKVMSKFELRRLCAAVNAQQIMTLDTPTPEELGRCDLVEVRELAGQKMVVFAQTNETTKLSTIILRGPTNSILDDVERALDDAINTYKALTRDGRMLPGGGATEMELFVRLGRVAAETSGMDQYAMKKYAQAFDIIPTTLAEVSGYNAVDLVTRLVADHQGGHGTHGLDLLEGATADVVPVGVLDVYLPKFWAIKLATDAAVTVLRVDHIIMAKPAGGPKARDGPGMDEDD